MITIKREYCVGLMLFFCLVAVSTARVLDKNSVSEANWPQWRGPQASGVSTEKNLPTEWSDTSNVYWKTEIPGRGHSSPIIWDKKIFLTTSIEGPIVPGAKAVTHIRRGVDYRHPDSVGGDHSYTIKVLCLDRDTGKILWEKTAYDGTVHDDRHRKNTFASATPVTDGKYVWTLFDAEGVYCYDFDGKLIWKKSLGKIAKMGMGNGMSPVLYENLVILQCDQEDGGPDSFITALDKLTGREVWRVARTQRKTWATPVLVRTAQRTELIASGAESTVSYDPATGKELWRSEGVVSHAIPSAVAGHGMVFVSGGSSGQPKLAIGIRLGGSGDLKGSPFVVWKYNKGTAYVPSPILYGDYLYLMTDGGIITCLEAKTGEVKYEGGRVPVPATFTSSPVAFEDKVLLTSEDGDTFVIKAGPVFEVIRTNSLGEPVYASIAIGAGKLFIRGAKHLYCIGKK
ncbi:MAG TPA: PQQ-binding-like beta-propeller repeat protein [Blastocatellia bacterium]|nr:PQQ-binding-like beta-propeller repeat protein [Blastocatellia bacterium]